MREEPAPTPTPERIGGAAAPPRRRAAWRLFAAGALALFTLAAFSLFLFQRALLYHPSRAIVAPDTAGVTAERIATPDGETLFAWWAPPPRGGPVFLFFDGNGGRPEIQRGRWRRVLAGGAGFLAVYYRGYSGSTGSPTEEGLHIDARAGYDWLRAKGYGAHDIVIHGMSLGSGVAVQLAAERPARALILEAPFTSVLDVVRDSVPFTPGFVIQDKFLSRDWIGRVRMPVLIVHGDADQVVPIAQGEEMFRLANAPKEFVRVPGARHAALMRHDLYAHIWAFLAAHP